MAEFEFFESSNGSQRLWFEYRDAETGRWHNEMTELKTAQEVLLNGHDSLMEICSMRTVF